MSKNSPAARALSRHRIDHHMWAWPLTAIEPFPEPIPMRGAQGFWHWSIKEAA